MSRRNSLASVMWRAFNATSMQDNLRVHDKSFVKVGGRVEWSGGEGAGATGTLSQYHSAPARSLCRCVPATSTLMRQCTCLPATMLAFLQTSVT